MNSIHPYATPTAVYIFDPLDMAVPNRCILLDPSHVLTSQDRVSRGMEKGEVRGKMMVSLMSRFERNIHCE